MISLSATYSLEQVIQEAMLEVPERQRSEREYERYKNFALSGLRRLRVMVTKDGKRRVKIEPNNINRYTFPTDLETFICMYVPVYGRVWKLTYDKGIIVTKTVSGNDESHDEDYGEGQDQPTAQLNTFGSEGGINIEGYYTIDYENREIQINANRKSEIVIEYTTLGSVTSVPTIYVEAIKAWIFWRDALRDRTSTSAYKAEMERDFNNRVKDIKKNEDYSIEEYMDAWRRKSLIRGS